MCSQILISFDIDGTLQSGNPAGPIPLAVVRRAQSYGWIVGSCSDRTLREQRDMWTAEEIVVDFVCAKHNLGELRQKFVATSFIHIGDTRVDQHFAEQAGFEYVDAAAAVKAQEGDAWVSWVDTLAGERTKMAEGNGLCPRRGRAGSDETRDG
jgi:hypothetical protein